MESNIIFWQSECINFDAEILISNASSYDRLKNVFDPDKRIRFLDVNKNFWWSESVNHAIKVALDSNSDFIIITNDDMIYPKGILNVFKKYANPDSVLTIPQLQVDGKLYFGANICGYFRNFVSLETLNEDIQYIDITNGSCLFIPANIFRKIGLFNSSELPHYYSDTEFMLRLKNFNYKLKILDYNFIVQGPPTEFSSRFSFYNIFIHKGSPLNLKAVIFFGLKLYGNYFNLFFGNGLNYTITYIFNVIKFEFKKLINSIRLDNA